MFIKFTIIILPATFFFLESANCVESELYYQWDYVNYTWPSSKAYEKAIQDGYYIKEHNIISGIKVWNNRLYLTVPRFKEGVPATLTSTSIHLADEKISAPWLEPYPSWEMQRIGDCSALQLVQNVEIDPEGKMWIINNGRIEVKTDHSKTLCPTRLMILDVENNGEVMLDYVFPERVVHTTSVHLTDIIIDHEDGGFAYIIDNDRKHPGIVVFSLRDRTSWKIHYKSMRIDDRALNYVAKPIESTIISDINGIALSPASIDGNNRLLYYSLRSSYEMFTIPTFILKSGRTKNIDRHLQLLGRKLSLSEGMAMSASGILYYGLPFVHSICSWNSNCLPFDENQEIMIENSVLLDSPESFAIDCNGWLWNTVKAKFVEVGEIGKSIVNVKIIRTKINSKSYQYYKNGSAPIIPTTENLLIFGKLMENMKFAISHLQQKVFLFP